MLTTSTERAQRRLERISHDHPDVFRLARLASLAARIEARLLRRLRFEFLRDIDVGIEADLWFGPLVESSGPDRIVLDASVADLLREDLAADRTLLARAFAVLEDVHRNLPDSIRLEEQLGFLALSLGDNAAGALAEALRPALRAIAQGGESARPVAQWVMRALPRAHPNVRRSPAALTLMLQASLILGNRRVLKTLPDDPLAIEDVAWSLPAEALAGRKPLGVELLDGGIRFVPPGSGVPMIDLPRTNPRLVEVSWANGPGRVIRMIEAEAGGGIDTDPGVELITLRTLAGDEYALERRSETEVSDHSAEVAAPPRCFVIMGFGLKVDFATSRSLDLDASYRILIKPTVEAAGYDCIRADEMLRPGAIDDTAEFDQLLSADVVIADLSTLPSGVIYKLGIRHGLRPRTTIVITANEIPPLDLNQRVIRYEHAGRDIGFHETTRFRQTLTAALKQATESAQPDSPLYYHLPDLHPPSLHDVAGPPSDTGESVAASSTDRRGQRSCFVVMGFGEKTDFETGRLLNLDKSYQNIIKPAAIESGLDCRRADEMATTSGLINAEVLRELLTADLVIADLSTNNTDTLYMLGMRHALSPHGTLLIAEHQFRSPFSDSLHMYIRTYEHLGQDIRFEEVMRLRQLLKDLIPAVLASHEIDSPVYRQLTALSPPYLAK